MKRTIGFAVVALAAVGCFLGRAQADPPPPCGLQIGWTFPENQDGMIAPNEIIQVELFMSCVPPEGLLGYDAFIKYDHTILQLVSGSYELFDFPLTFIDDDDAPQIELSAITLGPPVQLSGTICILRFRAIAEGETSIQFIADHEPPTVFADGQIEYVYPETGDSPPILVSQKYGNSFGGGG